MVENDCLKEKVLNMKDHESTNCCKHIGQDKFVPVPEKTLCLNVTFIILDNLKTNINLLTFILNGQQF